MSDFNPFAEKLVSILVNKTQNYNKDFFRLQTNFYLSLIASAMGVKIKSLVAGTIPINFYGVNLSASGSGKGFSTNFLENTILKTFRNKFINEVYPQRAKLSLDSEAINRSTRLGISHQEALDKLEKEFRSYGAFKFTFDSATTPAIKQFRQALLLAKIGSINLIIDEIGSNLKANLEPLATFLELYDAGLVKDKLTKSTQDNARFQELHGQTSSNLLMFGTPTKLLDGASTENEFFDLLDTGYARRCFFAFSKKNSKLSELSVDELYEAMVNQNQDDEITKITHKLGMLANVNLAGHVLETNPTIDKKLLAYRRECEILAENLPEHQSILKSEISHRYFKVLKLAGTYAFLDTRFEILEEHIDQAIAFAEESGKALKSLLEREKPYEKLAKYIAEGKGKQFTQVDLIEELPYYKGTAAQKAELMGMAVAWGYSNNIVIKKYLKDGIEFYSGESLDETNLNEMILAYSQHMADGYINFKLSWDKLPKLVQSAGYHWINHFTSDQRRTNDSMIKGFNMVVLDIDSETTLNQAISVLDGYEYLIHTTKRHQFVDQNTGEMYGDRFRIILPINYILELNDVDYKAFMQNIASFFPFTLDKQTFQRSRKWSCNPNAQIIQGHGKLLDVLPFIPKTTREAKFKEGLEDIKNLNNLERWFSQNMEEEGRNNQILKYALMLLDSGLDVVSIRETISNFNAKLPNPLDQEELEHTVFVTLTKKAQSND